MPTTTHHQGNASWNHNEISLTPVRMAIIKKENNGCGEKESLCTADGNVNWCNQYGKQYGIPQKIKNETTIWSSDSTRVFLFFYFTILYWFCHTLTWIRHGYTWVPNSESLSHLSPHIISLGHPSAPAPSILYPVSNLDWWFDSYMIVYMFQCHSPKSSHPLPLPQSPKVCSIHLCLFCCLTYRVIITIFLNSIYMF